MTEPAPVDETAAAVRELIAALQARWAAEDARRDAVRQESETGQVALLHAELDRVTVRKDQMRIERDAAEARRQELEARRADPAPGEDTDAVRRIERTR